ncbi:alpha/beta-hydrolase, putative [Plasmodium relictum]|uniref:Alpha/beta-hydrolase, putative n=1 Tax=Plasmodium relictum TaxID=85471 RepID=A0A1J1HDX1_PLARL|nr:alpha/beta-hydrolase, putative [Plasmodium relictum]CRH01787.1 alpha/beta-hydrolase, putative [Plasmodium relictum]
MLYETKIECKKKLKDMHENNYDRELMEKSYELINLTKNEKKVISNEELVSENNSNPKNEQNKNLIKNCNYVNNMNNKDDLKSNISKENKEKIKNVQEELKNSNNEEKHVKDNYIIYDDGNPEINFFINKDNLKIARYSWKVKNPKAYIFALHGITSHLRNEYLNFLGRPHWVDEKKKEKKEKEQKEKKEKEKKEKKDKKKENDRNENVSKGELSKNINKEEMNYANDIYKSNTNQNIKENANSFESFPSNTHEKIDLYSTNLNNCNHGIKNNNSNNNLNFKENEKNEIEFNNRICNEKEVNAELEMDKNNYIFNKNKIEADNVSDSNENKINQFYEKSKFLKKKKLKEKILSSISSNNTISTFNNDTNNSKKTNIEEKKGKSKLSSIFFNDYVNKNTYENMYNNKFNYGELPKNKKYFSFLKVQRSAKDKKKKFFRCSSAERFGFSIYRMKKKNMKKEIKCISETNSLVDEEVYNFDAFSCSSSEEDDKKNLEKKLTMFLSCSSCVSNFMDDTNALNNRIISESLYNELSSNKVIDDDNVLLIDKNDTIKQYDSNVYYCSMCGICNYCTCGNRSLSYKNSWIEKLNQNNFSFFGIDNQSHGLSEGWQNQRCYVEDFDNFIADAIQALEIFVNEWKEKNELKPIIIMGLSMGGCIALRTLETLFKLNKEWKIYVKALVLVSPMISLGKQKNKITNRLLISATKFLKYFFPRLTVNVKENNTFYPWIQHDSQLDPLQYCGSLKVKIAAECVNAADNCLDYHVLKYVEESDVDIIVIQSKYDCIVDPTGTINFMKKMVRLCENKEEILKENEKENVKSNQKSSLNINKEKETELNGNKKVYNDMEEAISNIYKSEDINNIENNNNTDIINNDINNSNKTNDETINEIDYKNEISNDSLMNNYTTNNNIYTNINSNEKIIEKEESLSNNLIEMSKKTDLLVQSNKTSNYSDVINEADENYILPIENIKENKMEIWNYFDHGYYKYFKLKKNTRNKSDFSSDEKNFKNLTIYILKYGCHTLPIEPNTKETVNILVDWLNNIYE